MERFLGGKIALFVVYLATSTLYVLLNKRKSKYYWKTRFDDLVPLISVFVFPYLFYFVYHLVALIYLWDSNLLGGFFWTMIVANVTAAIFWYLLPNGVMRPKVKGNNISTNVLNLVYQIDKDDTNGFPSAHVFHTIIISYFLAMYISGASLIILITSILILASTVFTKQHYVVDVIGGIIWSVVSLLVVGML